MKKLLEDISACIICEEHLPLGPRPVVAASPHSKIMVIGQAPGTAVHKSGIPWNDPSGRRLREWLDVDEELFYNPDLFAIVPMGFCYPGKGKSGDLPPRQECAPQWHTTLWKMMPQLELTLLIGQYAQQYYLKDKSKKNLTQTVGHFRDYLPDYFPLVHPSPRNQIWMKKNQWFEEEVIPVLRSKVKAILQE